MPVLLLLGACTSGPGEIFRQFSFDNEQSITTGSRQRIVSSADVGSRSRPGLVDPKRIVCAEPSPDVAVIVANAFGVSFSVLGQGAGALSASQAEGVIQLAERTASIQLLRDQMYRACEAYANGAVSGTTYSLIMSKMNKVMVSLMLGETAGGAFGRSLAAAGSAASAKAKAAASGFQNAVKDIDEAATKLAAANKEVARTEDAWKTKQKAADDAKGKEGGDTLQADADKLKEEHQEAVFKRDALKELLKTSISAAAESAAEIKNITAGGGLTHKPDAAIAGILKGMQKQYLDDDMSDAVISACLVDMSLADASDVALRKKKAEAIEKVVEADKALRKATAASLANPSSLTATDFNLAKADYEEATTRRDILKNLDRFSGLGSFCTDNLKDFMTEVRKDQQKRKMAEIELEKIKAKKTCADCRVSDYAKALKICAALESEQKKQCIAGLKNAAATEETQQSEPDTKPKPEPEPEPETDPDRHSKAELALAEDEATAILAAFGKLDKFPNPDSGFKIKDREKKEPFEILQGYVEEIQLALGMEPEKVDGLLGPETRAAIKKSRKDKNESLDEAFLNGLLKAALEKDYGEPDDETEYEAYLAEKDKETARKFLKALGITEASEGTAQTPTTPTSPTAPTSPAIPQRRPLTAPVAAEPADGATAEPEDKFLAKLNAKRVELGLPQNGHVTRLLVRLVFSQK